MATIQSVKDAFLLAALPAAGAYGDGIAIPLNNFEEITFGVSYIEGAGAGTMGYKVEFAFVDNPGVNDWYQGLSINGGTAVAGTDLNVLAQRVEVTYSPVGAATEKFMTNTYRACGKWARISLKEIGATGTPGTASAVAIIKGAN